MLQERRLHLFFGDHFGARIYFRRWSRAEGEAEREYTPTEATLNRVSHLSHNNKYEASFIIHAPARRVSSIFITHYRRV